MIYLKINDEIRILIEMIKDSFKLGYKEYCKHQLIPHDEFEILRKEMQFKNLKTFSDEEYRNTIKSTESVYMHSTHICQSAEVKRVKRENPEANEKNEEIEKFRGSRDLSF